MRRCLSPQRAFLGAAHYVPRAPNPRPDISTPSGPRQYTKHRRRRGREFGAAGFEAFLEIESRQL
jgi:hypothetical protein